MNQHWSNKMQWLNRPPRDELHGDVLQVSTASNGDFWRSTFYGYVRDSGHFLGLPAGNDFTASITFSAKYHELYDQAGLMLRVDDSHWIKAGAEFVDGKLSLSVVVTNGNSDWSCQPAGPATGGVTIRASRYGEAVRIEHRAGDGSWQMARLAYLKPSARILVGPMCCSPMREGFEVGFRDFALGPSMPRDLYA